MGYEKPRIPLSACADFVEYCDDDEPPEKDDWESPLQRKQRRHKEKVETHKKALKKLIENYDPHKDSNAAGDPFKTLFVARVSYDTTEKKLKREFEVFGSIKKVRMVYDQKGKPRGYAFVEYEHERDLKNAYKQGDGKKIDGRRVMVDVERGRTVEGWLPRRLGGGRGPGRVGKPSKKNLKKQKAIDEAKKEKEREERKKDKDERAKGGTRDDKGDRDRGRRDDRDKKDDRKRDDERKRDDDRKRDDRKRDDRKRDDRKPEDRKKDDDRKKEDDRKRDDKKRDRSKSRDRGDDKKKRDRRD